MFAQLVTMWEKQILQALLESKKKIVDSYVCFRDN